MVAKADEKAHAPQQQCYPLVFRCAVLILSMVGTAQAADLDDADGCKAHVTVLEDPSFRAVKVNPTAYADELIAVKLAGANSVNQLVLNQSLDWSMKDGPILLIETLFFNDSARSDIVGLVLKNTGNPLDVNELRINYNSLTMDGHKRQHPKLVKRNESILCALPEFYSSLLRVVANNVSAAYNFSKLVSTDDAGSGNEKSVYFSWQWAASDHHLVATKPENTPNDNVAIYNEWAASYDEDVLSSNYTSHQIVVEQLYAVIAPHAPYFEAMQPVILDAGCGTGLTGCYLRERFANKSFVLKGVDIAPEMLNIAATKNCYDELKQSDVSTLIPFHSNMFDIILASGLFYPGSVRIHGINELLRVLKRDGVLIVTMRSSYYEENEQVLRNILMYQQVRIVKKVKRPYHGVLEAVILTLSANPFLLL